MSNSLCQLASDWTGTYPIGGMSAEVKIDGWRCLWFRGRDGKPRLWTRNGMPLEGAEHLAYRCMQMEVEAGEPLFLDGEVQVDGTLAATKQWFESGWRRGGDKGKLYLFDAMTHAEWATGGTDRPQHMRKAFVQELVEATAEQWDWRPGSNGRDDPTAVQTMGELWLGDAAAVISEAARVWAAGGEGLMLKDADAPYRRNRNSTWLKVKQENAHKWYAKLAA